MFSEKTMRFLFENRMENSREWFAEHRSEYEEYVLQPLIDLTKALTPVVESADGLIVTVPRVNKVISRIYRDVRFSNDKSLYRDSMWLSFKRDKKQFVQFPEFYVVITRKGFFYGCGYYMPTPDALASVRERILEDDPFFLKAQKAFRSGEDFVLDGDRYKKTRFPDAAEEKRIWLDLKTPRVEVQKADLSLLYSDALASTIENDFRKMIPIYRFFLHAETVKQVGM